jgi:hypothetical protein
VGGAGEIERDREGGGRTDFWGVKPTRTALSSFFFFFKKINGLTWVWLTQDTSPTTDRRRKKCFFQALLNFYFMKKEKNEYRRGAGRRRCGQFITARFPPR